MSRFTRAPSASGDGIKDGYATLSAAHTAALADDLDDGAVYQTTNGRLYCWHNASKGLWPAGMYHRINDVISNALGDCYMLPADTEAQAVARGWVKTVTGGGTVTKAADGPLIVSSPNPATKTAELQFNSSGSESKTAALLLVTGIVGTNMASTRLRMLSDQEQMRLSMTNGAAGTCDILQSFNAVEGDQVGDLDVTTDVWILMVIDSTDSKRLCYAKDVEADEVLAVEAGKILTGAYTPQIEIQTQNTTSIPSELRVKYASMVSLT